MSTSDLPPVPDLDANDYTVYCKADDHPTLKCGTYPAVLTPSNQDARVQVCKCFGGALLSLTVRRLGKRRGPHPQNPPSTCPRISASDYLPTEHRGEYLNRLDELATFFFDQVSDLPWRGLIIVSGATNACKSQIARGLIYRYLEEYVRSPRSRRRAHLVTFEDPPEVYFHDVTKCLDEESCLDYTPRTLGRDTETLKQALNDALRQTPTVFYAGETRNMEDLGSLLEFGATGHLAITTMHAGSLTETIGKALKAVHAQTPAQRSSVAHAVLAAIHLTASTTESSRFLAPAIWRSTAEAQMAFTVDGLSSILPYWNLKAGSVGRAACLKKLMDCDDCAAKNNWALRTAILGKALQLDTEGM
jgi:hypothetical protein